MIWISNFKSDKKDEEKNKEIIEIKPNEKNEIKIEENKNKIILNNNIINNNLYNNTIKDDKEISFKKKVKKL